MQIHMQFALLITIPLPTLDSKYRPPVRAKSPRSCTPTRQSSVEVRMRCKDASQEYPNLEKQIFLKTSSSHRPPR